MWGGHIVVNGEEWSRGRGVGGKILIGQGRCGVVLWRRRSSLAISNFALVRRGDGSRTTSGLEFFNGIVGRFRLLGRLDLVRLLDRIEAIVGVTGLMLDFLGLG